MHHHPHPLQQHQKQEGDDGEDARYYTSGSDAADGILALRSSEPGNCSPAPDPLDVVESSLLGILQHLESSASVALDYLDESAAPLTAGLLGVSRALCTLDLELEKNAVAGLWVPREVVAATDRGEDPVHRVTAEYMERLAAENQYTYGKQLAAAHLHSLLDKHMRAIFPLECAEHDCKFVQGADVETQNPSEPPSS